MLSTWPVSNQVQLMITNMNTAYIKRGKILQYPITNNNIIPIEISFMRNQTCICIIRVRRERDWWG